MSTQDRPTLPVQSGERGGRGLLPVQPGSIKPLKAKEVIFPSKVNLSFVNKLLPWVEEYWHVYKRYPSFTDWNTKWGFVEWQIETINSTKLWRKCLERRGISIPDNNGRFSLTDKQIAAVAIMSNFSDRRPVEARLLDIGVEPEVLQGWMSNPSFQTYFRARAEDAFNNVAPVATIQLAKKIEQGYFPALKFYYEITGQAQSPETINVKKTLQIVIEAIQRHVTDPEVLRAISDEVNNVRGMNGL